MSKLPLDISDLKKLVSQDKIEQVLLSLTNLNDDFPKEIKSKSLLVFGRWNALKTQLHKGTILNEEIQLEKNKIRSSILDILNDFEKIQKEKIEKRNKFLTSGLKKGLVLTSYIILFSSIIWWLFQEQKGIPFQCRLLVDELQFKYIDGPTDFGQGWFKYCTWQNFEKMEFEGSTVKIDDDMLNKWEASIVSITEKLILNSDPEVPNVNVKFGAARLEELFLQPNALITISLPKRGDNFYRLSIQQDSAFRSNLVYVDSMIVETEQVTINGLPGYSTIIEPIRFKIFSPLNAQEVNLKSYTGVTDLHFQLGDNNYYNETSNLSIKNLSFFRSIETVAVPTILSGEIKLGKDFNQPLKSFQLQDGEALAITSENIIHVLKMGINKNGIYINFEGIADKLSKGQLIKPQNPSRIEWFWYANKILFVLILVLFFLASYLCVKPFF